MVASTTIQKNSLASDSRSAHDDSVESSRERHGQGMGEPGGAKGEREHDHEVGQRRGAFVLEAQAFHLFARGRLIAEVSAFILRSSRG